MFNWNKKEKPFASFGGFGGGGLGLAGAGDAALSASGGNIADGITPGNGYKYHTFGASCALVVNCLL